VRGLQRRIGVLEGEPQIALLRVKVLANSTSSTRVFAIYVVRSNWVVFARAKGEGPPYPNPSARARLE
jgi:hypothetical protein